MISYHKLTHFVPPDGRLKRDTCPRTPRTILLPGILLFQAIPFAEKWDAKWSIKSAESQSGLMRLQTAAACSPSAKL